MTVTALGTKITRDSDMIDRYEVQRAGGQPHIVSVRVSPDSGTPQEERCDCKGFKYRRDCSHITAVYESGQLGCNWDN